MTQSTAAKIYSLLASARSLTTEEIAEAVGCYRGEAFNILEALERLVMVKRTADYDWSRPDVGRVEL
jgi:DNA-binding IclR family transcriptional regulator